MKSQRKFFHILAMLLGAACSSAAVADGRISFPDTADGHKVLAVDFHVHTIWSDGLVWPTVRVDEARREGLSAIALTEHVEFTRQHEDLAQKGGFVDKNRAYEIAAAHARDNLLVIPGAEITRGVGHYNCLFIKDANALRIKGEKDAIVYTDLDKRFQRTDAKTMADADASLTEARRQGGFCFWNHPHWPGQPNHVSEVQPFHKGLIEEKKIAGLEVANGQGIFLEAIDIALQNNLAMLANSDTHRPIETDLGNTGLPHRTLTLLLAADNSPKAIRAALETRKSVGLYRNTLIGSQENVTAIVSAALTITRGTPPTAPDFPRNSETLVIENKATIPFTLTPIGHRLLNQGMLVHVPAQGKVTLWVTRVDPPGLDNMRFRLANSYVSSSESAEITLPISK